jgi:hypothetical protein
MISTPGRICILSTTEAAVKPSAAFEAASRPVDGPAGDTAAGVRAAAGGGVLRAGTVPSGSDRQTRRAWPTRHAPGSGGRRERPPAAPGEDNGAPRALLPLGRVPADQCPAPRLAAVTSQAGRRRRTSPASPRSLSGRPHRGRRARRLGRTGLGGGRCSSAASGRTDGLRTGGPRVAVRIGSRRGNGPATIAAAMTESGRGEQRRVIGRALTSVATHRAWRPG